MKAYEKCGILGIIGKKEFDLSTVCGDGMTFENGKCKADLSTACSDGMTFENGKCATQFSDVTYNVVGKGTFDEAKAMIRPGCRMLSKVDLIDNREKTLEFTRLLRQHIWVDAAQAEDGSFKWGDGTPMTMGEEGFWRNGEPNNWKDRGETHVDLRGDGFNDIRPDAKELVVEVCPVAYP